MIQSSPRPSLVRSRKFYIGVILVAALVLSSWYGASQYLQQLYPANSTSSSTSSSINVLFNYGNGRSHWYNSTRVPSGSTLYNVTVSIAKVDSKYVASVGDYQVNSINGFPNTSSSSYWAVWMFCTKDNAWAYSNWGAGSIRPVATGLSVPNSLGHSIILSSNALAWNFQSGGSESPAPVPGASKVDFCSS